MNLWIAWAMKDHSLPRKWRTHFETVFEGAFELGQTLLRRSIVLVFEGSLLNPKTQHDFSNAIRSLKVTLCDMDLINLATTCV